MNAISTQTAVGEKHIDFTDEQVRATLEGRMTQTRRALQFPAKLWEGEGWDWVKSVHEDGGGNWIAWSYDSPTLADFTKNAYPNGEGFPCPYGKPGERLWVREAWQTLNGLYGYTSRDEAPVIYRADGPSDADVNFTVERWLSPAQMPRRASRITLEITAVRVERVQDISEEDARAEGCVTWTGRKQRTARENFIEGWDELNATRGFGWSNNAWVWVIEFKRV